jgi:hypothetical protein
MMPLTTRYDDAFRYAHDLHRMQKRKGTSVPYISHLMVVSALVVEHGGDEDQAIGALLHDAVEDQGGAATLNAIESRFGRLVAEIVSDCTDSWEEPKPDWRLRKEAYLATLPAKPARSLLVSLADKTHNAESDPLRLSCNRRSALAEVQRRRRRDTVVLRQFGGGVLKGDARTPLTTPLLGSVRVLFLNACGEKSSSRLLPRYCRLQLDCRSRA